MSSSYPRACGTARSPSGRRTPYCLSVQKPRSTETEERLMAECIVEREGHTLIVTMNRPEARNALSAEMMQIMSEAWDEVNANPDIRVAILTGAGGHFCAGA